MRFIDGAERELGLLEAARLGRARTGEPLFPWGEDDLRPAVYAPESSFADFAASAISALFPLDIDPLSSLRLARAAFAEAPRLIPVEEGIVAIDLGRGPTGRRVDRDAAFLAALLGQDAQKRGPRLVLADGSGGEGAALAEAMSGIDGLRTVLLYPEGGACASIRPSLLEREGGSVRIVAVRGGRIAELMAAAAGTRPGGLELSLAGPANPARLAARIVEFAALFASSRSSASGEYFFGLREGDGIGLAACILAWRLGVPLTGIVMPCGSGSDYTECAMGLDPDGHELVSRLEKESPGLVKSLVAFREAHTSMASEALVLLESAGGPRIDRGGADMLAAAESFIDSSFRGHAKVFALIEGSGIVEDEIGHSPVPTSPDAHISSSLAELNAVLAR